MAKTILLVDDEEGIRKVLGISLSDAGYEVLTAENGEEALKIFRKIKPPIVLTDIKMPEVSGLDVLKEVREKKGDLPVIMITGYASEDTNAQALQLGVSGYIRKPYDVSQIRDIVAKTVAEV